jgi:cellulose biosynthesis protein BcsQ
MKEKVCVIDTDPQGSLTNWAKTRETGDIEVIASGARAASGPSGPTEGKGLHPCNYRHAGRRGTRVCGGNGRRRS